MLSNIACLKIMTDPQKEEGSSNKVYRAVHRETGEQFALKTVFLADR